MLGDNVRDQDFNWAELCELGSSPPSVEVAKSLDAMGSFPGYDVETGDARGASTQSLRKGGGYVGDATRNRWPKHRIGKLRRPVVPLMLALYDHADAGGFGEEHCEENWLPSLVHESPKSGQDSSGPRKRSRC